MTTARTVLCAAAALLLAAGQSSAGPADTIENECNTQLNLPAGACACIGRKAVAELNDQQVEMFIAMITNDEATAARLRGEMPVNEMVQTAMFMQGAPQACAGG